MSLRKLCALLCLCGACAYTTRRPEVSLGGVKATGDAPLSLFIPVADNTTARTGIEGVTTSTLRRTLGAHEGIQLVHKADEARFMLLVKVTRWESRAGASQSALGDGATGAAGGLDDKQFTAGDLIADIILDVQLVERMPGLVQRLVWRRPFARVASYTPSTRYREDTGSSSAPYINASREKIILQSTLEGIAQEVLEQATAEF